MSAYLISNIDVHDDQAYGQYAAASPRSSPATAAVSSFVAARSTCSKATPTRTGWL